MAKHDHDLGRLVTAQEREFELVCLAEDIEKGRVPDFAHRGLTATELFSGINFLSMADDVAKTAAALALKLGDARAKFMALLRTDLERLGTVDEIVNRLQQHRALGISAVPGAIDLVTETGAALVPVLTELLRTQAEAVVSEAATQGVEITKLGDGPLSENTKSVLNRQAGRLTIEPLTGAVFAQAESVVELASDATVEELFGIFDKTSRSLSEKPLSQIATTAASSAAGLGRQEAVLNAGREPESIYASELLDRNTCGFCRLVDGRNYRTLREARIDYPSGIYKNCEGGMLCRGALIMVWASEANRQ